MRAAELPRYLRGATAEAFRPNCPEPSTGLGEDPHRCERRPVPRWPAWDCRLIKPWWTVCHVLWLQHGFAMRAGTRLPPELLARWGNEISPGTGTTNVQSRGHLCCPQFPSREEFCPAALLSDYSRANLRLQAVQPRHPDRQPISGPADGVRSYPRPMARARHYDDPREIHGTVDGRLLKSFTIATPGWRPARSNNTHQLSLPPRPTSSPAELRSPP